MEIKVIRKTLTETSTIGELSIDGKFFCYTLEDKERIGPKVMHKTAIPKGRYEMILSFSNRFKVVMPQLLNVPNFEGIRIHSGNTSDQTEGCLLLGQTKATDFIGESRLAFSKFMAKINPYVGKEKIFITVE